MDKITKGFSTDITVNEGERSVVARITTAAVDRDGEVLVPQGCNSKDFERNPIVFFGHDYYRLPVGKVIGIKRDADHITAKVVLASRPDTLLEGEWVPDTILSLFQQNVLKGFSVGFIPLESRPATDRDIEKYGVNCRRVFSKWSLLELSVAPLPANQEAVALAVSKGLHSPMVKAVWGVDDSPLLLPAPVVASRHVVASIAALPEPVPFIEVKRVHRVVTLPPTEDTDAKVRKCIVHALNKARGKLYDD